MQGIKDGAPKQIFIYNSCDHKACYNEVGSQAISYTAGVPPVAAAMLIAKGVWDPKTMVNVEELDPDPFIETLAILGLPTIIHDLTQAGRIDLELTPKEIVKQLI